MSVLKDFEESNKKLGYKLLAQDNRSVTMYKVYGNEVVILQNVCGEVSIVSLWKNELKDLLSKID